MTREFRLFKCEMLDRSDDVTLFSLCVRSVKKDEVFLFSITALILKHKGKPTAFNFFKIKPMQKGNLFVENRVTSRTSEDN